MSEEERKKAYEFLQELEKNGYRYSADGREMYIVENVFNKIDKLQKENEELKEELFVERKTNISKYTIRNIIKNKLKEIESDADFETIEVLNELLNKIRLKNVYSFGKKMYIKEVI